MMTRNHRQESLCRAYVLAIAAQAGLTWSRPQEDYGIDLSLRHCAYWMSLKGYSPRTAIRTIRIAIPLTNVFSVEALLSLMERVREKERPMRFRSPWIDPQS